MIICTGFPTSCEVKYDIWAKKFINDRFEQPCLHMGQLITEMNVMNQSQGFPSKEDKNFLFSEKEDVGPEYPDIPFMAFICRQKTACCLHQNKTKAKTNKK